MYKIERITASSSGDRLLLKVSDGGGAVETISISCEKFQSLGLAKGEISDRVYDALVEASGYEQALIKGVRILGYGANSQKQVEAKLCRSGISRSVAHKVSSELSCRGYLNEESDAIRLSEGLIRKGYGRRRIIAALRAKGYSDEALNSVEQTLDEMDLDDACIRVARAKLKGLKNERAEVQKAIAKLVNLGYNVSEAKRAIETVLSERN